MAPRLRRSRGEDRPSDDRATGGERGRDEGAVATSGARERGLGEARERQREAFGGFQLGAAFFGWLVAVGIAVILTAIVGAAGTAIGLSSSGKSSDVSKSAGTIGIVGGALLIVILAIAYYAGGYVAGRLARFDGARQGLGTWIIGLVVTILIAVAGYIAGSQYNVFKGLNLPRIPVSGEKLTGGGVITLVAIAIVSLIAAILGGKLGERFHRKVDRAAYE